MSGKGDKRRPRQYEYHHFDIDYKTYSENWDYVFGKKRKEKKDDQAGSVRRPKAGN